MGWRCPRSGWISPSQLILSGNVLIDTCKVYHLAILNPTTLAATAPKKLPPVHSQLGPPRPSLSWHFEADSHTVGLGFPATLEKSCSRVNTWSVWKAGDAGLIAFSEYSTVPVLLSMPLLSLPPRCVGEAINPEFIFLPSAICTAFDALFG